MTIHQSQLLLSPAIPFLLPFRCSAPSNAPHGPSKPVQRLWFVSAGFSFGHSSLLPDPDNSCTIDCKGAIDVAGKAVRSHTPFFRRAMILRSTTAVTRSTLLSVSTFSSAVPVPALRHHRYAHSKAQRWPAHSNAWNEETRHEREQQPLQVQVQTKSGKSQNQLPFGLPPPRHLVARLDEHVIGQARAKKYLAVAVYNHYLRVFSNEESEALALSESDDHLAGLKAEQQAENVNTRKQRKRGPRIDAGPECSSEEDHHTKQNDRIEANCELLVRTKIFDVCEVAIKLISCVISFLQLASPCRQATFHPRTSLSPESTGTIMVTLTMTTIVNFRRRREEVGSQIGRPTAPT